MRYRSPAQMPASSPPAPPRISTITFLSSLGSRSTIASRISSSRRSIRSRASLSSARISGSSPSASSSSAPSASETASRHSSASFAAGASWLKARPASAKRCRSPITSGSDICACASEKRASICSTRDSIIESISLTAGLPPPGPPASGRDLDPYAVFRRRRARVLDRQHRLQRNDRDLDLLVVGLAGRELLQLHARPDDQLDPGLAAIAAGPLDYLEGEAGGQRAAH